MFFPRPDASPQAAFRGLDPSGYLSLSHQALERRLSTSESRAANRSHEGGRPWISDPVLRAARLRAEILQRCSS